MHWDAGARKGAPTFDTGNTDSTGSSKPRHRATGGVLFLCAGSGIGGMERVVLTLAREFTVRHVPVRVILPDAEGAVQTRAWFVAQGVRADVDAALAHAFGRRRLGGVPALRTLVATSPSPVVNVHYGMNFPSLNDVLAIRLAGKRVVASLHAGGGTDPPARRPRARKTRIAAALCSSIVAVSGFQAERLIRDGVPPEKVRIVPNGVALPPYPLDRTTTRMCLGLPARAFVVATAARLTDRKGIADLIRALPDGAFLVVAGEGPERVRLEALAQEQLSGRHRFLGHVADMSVVYAAADLFALPSYEESFGLVFAEAALHSLPSVGTSVGGVPETVLAGQTGLLVPPGDLSRLAAALRLLQQDDALRDRLGRAACLRAHREFTAERMADRYEAVLFGTNAIMSHRALRD
jgi:glycosyltransferase involved in cell wall biosynthesis